MSRKLIKLKDVKPGQRFTSSGGTYYGTPVDPTNLRAQARRLDDPKWVVSLHNWVNDKHPSLGYDNADLEVYVDLPDTTFADLAPGDVFTMPHTGKPEFRYTKLADTNTSLPHSNWIPQYCAPNAVVEKVSC